MSKHPILTKELIEDMAYFLRAFKKEEEKYPPGQKEFIVGAASRLRNTLRKLNKANVKDSTNLDLALWDFLEQKVLEQGEGDRK